VNRLTARERAIAAGVDRRDPTLAQLLMWARLHALSHNYGQEREQ
jgi:hypothetical protein